MVGVACPEVCRLSACEIAQDRNRKAVVLADAYIPRFALSTLFHKLYSDLALVSGGRAFERE